MKFLTGSIAAAFAVMSAGMAYGETIQYCPSNANNVCFAVGVPSSSASANSGNIYFQITAPTSYSWVALGTGTGMSGSNIFVMYQDGKGNLTLSPRRGTFHTTPPVDSSSTGAKLTLLAGSGVSGSTMTANIACSNCQSWTGGGKMSLASTSTPWIAAWLAGSSIASTSANANINQHSETATFQLDLTKAAVSTDSNPFVSSSGSGSGSGSGTGSGSGSGSGSGTGSGSGSGSGSSGGGGVTVISAGTLNPTILAAHGVVMALVMVVLYPLGATLMPLVGKWWLHAAWQTLSLLLMWAGFALGVVCAQERNMLFNQSHTVFGTVIVCLLMVQPALGFIHHSQYTKTQSRGLFSHAHIWFGRIMMMLGVINGGLGLQLAMAPNSLVIAYSVVAGVLFLLYGVSKAVGSMKSKKSKQTINKEAPRSPREA